MVNTKEPNWESDDPFVLLGIPKNSDLKQIKEGYVNLIKQFKPEKNPAEFQKIREAYEKAIEQISYRDFYQEDEESDSDEINQELDSAEQEDERAEIKERYSNVLSFQYDNEHSGNKKPLPAILQAYLNEKQDKAKAYTYLEKAIKDEDCAQWIYENISKSELYEICLLEGFEYQFLKNQKDKHYRSELLGIRWKSLLLKGEFDRIFAEMEQVLFGGYSKEMISSLLLICCAVIWDFPEKARDFFQKITSSNIDHENHFLEAEFERRSHSKIPDLFKKSEYFLNFIQYGKLLDPEVVYENIFKPLQEQYKKNLSLFMALYAGMKDTSWLLLYIESAQRLQFYSENQKIQSKKMDEKKLFEDLFNKVEFLIRKQESHGVGFVDYKGIFLYIAVGILLRYVLKWTNIELNLTVFVILVFFMSTIGRLYFLRLRQKKIRNRFAFRLQKEILEIQVKYQLSLKEILDFLDKNRTKLSAMNQFRHMFERDVIYSLMDGSIIQAYY